MLPKFVIIVLLALQVNNAHSQGHYTIVASKNIRPNADYHVAVSVQDSPQQCNIVVSLSNEAGYKKSQEVTLDPYSTQVVQFQTDNLPSGQYRIAAEGLKGIIFKNETLINLHLKNSTILTQTDKAIYKPGDLVHFRILFLDSNLRPSRIDGPIKITITDANDNRIRQWSDAPVTRGVFEGELQLADEVALGDWKIRTEFNGNNKVKKFEVAEYVLPKFDVIIDTAKHQTYRDEKLRAVIRTKYFYGKPVKGEATVSVFPKIHGLFQPLISNLITRKVTKIDGKADIEFDIEKELNFNQNYEQTVQIEVVVEEEFSGRKQNTTTEVTLHKSKYKIILKKASEQYKPGLPFVVTATVVNHDGSPIQDRNSPLIVRTSYEGNENTVAENNYNLDENGIVRFSTIIERKNGFYLTAYYLDAEESLGWIQKADSRAGDYLQISLKTEKPTINKDVSVEVQSNENLRFLTYEILGRGDIIVSNTIEVPNQNHHIFQFFASFAMFPKAQIVVHYIRDNEIVSDRLEIEFGNELQNEVNIEISASKANPDQAVDITVSSRPNSFIGLLGVDQHALMLKSGNDLYESEALDELDQYNQIYYPPGWRGKRQFSYPYVDIWMDFDSAGAVLLTNANPVERKPPTSTITPYDNEIIHGVITTIKKTDIGPAHVLRTNTRPPLAGPYAFSRIPKPFRNHPHIHTKHIIEDTWLFVNFTTGADGKQSIRKALPNSMTTWVISGFSIDPINGLGLSKRPQTVQAYQQFMVTVDLPHSVKRGETLAIPIMIFNNLNRDLDTEVTLHNEDQDFDFVDVSEGAGDNPKIELYRRKRVSVTSGKGSPASFIIRPKKVGLMTIKVKATSPYAGDEVIHVIPVEAEGIPQYFTKSILLDLRDKPNYDGNLTIEIPKNAIPDSSRIEVAALGDIFTGTIQNLDKLIRMPVGCGEQNMLTFTSNIIVLDYLKATNQLTPDIRNKARNLLNLGYQKELAYIHKDGSFSAFGGDDKNGSTWLTALVARSFRMATNYIEVEEKIILDALSWLSKLQAPDGSFPEAGVISHSDLQSSGIALTAYTLTAFLENRDQTPMYRNAINKAMDYVARNIAGSEDLYSLAIASYTLQLAQHNSKDYILQTFDSRSKYKGDLKWWEKPIPKSDEKNVWYQQKNTVNIELSAYGLLALIEAGHINDGLPVFKWLISQRDSLGGFVSTQDTAIGLLALAKYSEKIRGTTNNVQIRVKYNEGTENLLNVNDGNALALQNVELPKSVRLVNITASGRGLAVLQLTYRYNTNVTAAWPRFTLDPQINKNSNPDYLHLSVCANFVPAGGINESNMAVMEVNFPTGFTADVFTLPSLESDIVKKVEAKNDDTTVVIYFDRIGIRELCPTLDAFRTNKVAKQRQSAVTIFDYYDNSRRARQFYNAPKTTLCDICDGNDCGESCAIRASKQRSSKSAFDGDTSAIQGNSNDATSILAQSAFTFISLCVSYYFI